MKRTTKVIIFGGLGVLAVTGIAMAAKGYGEHRQMKRMFSPAKILEHVDQNADKAISLEELNGAMSKQFALADTDGDGSVNKVDVIAAIDEHAPAKRIKRHSGRITDRLFIGADVNDDSIITKDEIENRMAKFHALADWNDDGKVEMAELKRLRASMPGRWGKKHRRGDREKTAE